MFERRVEKSSQWITENEDSFQNYSNTEEDYHERTISDGRCWVLEGEANFAIIGFFSPRPTQSKAASGSQACEGNPTLLIFQT